MGSRIDGSLRVNDSLSASSLSLDTPAPAPDVVHQHHITLALDGAAADKTVPIYIARKDATVKSVEVAMLSAGDTSNSKTEVDIQRAAQGGASATILSSVIEYGGTDYEIKTGTVTTTDLGKEEILIADVSVTGAASAGSDMIITVALNEAG